MCSIDKLSLCMVFDALIIFPQLLYFDQEDNGGLSLALQVLYIFFCMFVKHNACIFLKELIISDVMVFHWILMALG